MWRPHVAVWRYGHRPFDALQIGRLEGERYFFVELKAFLDIASALCEVGLCRPCKREMSTRGQLRQRLLSVVKHNSGFVKLALLKQGAAENDACRARVVETILTLVKEFKGMTCKSLSFLETRLPEMNAGER